MSRKTTCRVRGGLMAMVACAVVSHGCDQWTDAQNAQIGACLSSLSGAFMQYPPDADVTSNPPVPALSWVPLSQDEAGALLVAIAQRAQVSECGPWTGTGPLLDPWNNRVRVDIRDGGGGSIQVRVWSKGPDGKAGTDDDVSNTGFGAVEYGRASPRR